MKKLFLVSLTVVLSLLITPLNAQVKIQIGPKVGINIASVGGSDGDTFLGESLDSRFGFGGGAFFMFQFGNIFAVQPEIYYSMKGATFTTMDVDITLQLDYMEVPVLLKAIIPVQGSTVRPTIYAGPVLSFNTTAKIEGEGGGQTASEDVSDFVQSTDFSLTFGGGVGFLVGMHEIGFDIRYILGLKSFDDSDDALDIKNNAINFNVYFGLSVL
jgi:hypothetical protein